MLNYQLINVIKKAVNARDTCTVFNLGLKFTAEATRCGFLHPIGVLHFILILMLYV